MKKVCASGRLTGAFRTGWLLLILLFPLNLIHTQPLVLANGWGIDPPSGWDLIGAEDDTLTFAPPGEAGFLQIKRYPGERWDDIADMQKDLLHQLQAESSSVENFSYRNRDSFFADLMFTPVQGPALRAYMVAIEGHREDIVLMGIAEPDMFEELSVVLLSGMDSFSIGDQDRLQPGPVTTWLFADMQPEKEAARVSFEGTEYTVVHGAEELEATAWVIEREASLLVTYTGHELSVEAWKRYYRIIYRDAYSRLTPFFLLFDRIIEQAQSPEEERQIAERLLSWVQNFEYVRTGGTSDLEGPLSVAVNRSGDCDSRGLLLSAIYNHLGMESVLMVSERFGHSIVGVLLPGQGARFSFQGKNYLVAETTVSVGIGLIDAAMADPSGWIGIDFFRYPR
jgi:hypothetical protein